MNKRIPSAENRRLAERLHREAIESRPAFSESLHRRIVKTINASSSEMPQNMPAPALRRDWHRRPTVAAAVACLLLGVVAIGWWMAALAERQNALDTERRIAQSQASQLFTLDEMTDRAAAGLDGVVASVTLTREADHLKHDARLAAHSLLERLPVDVEMIDALAVDER